MTEKEKVKEIVKRLSDVWPSPKTELAFRNPFELLVATILSAQTTDKVVNSITPALFSRYPDPKQLSKADETEIFEAIRKVNFAGNKAKNLKKMATILVENFHGTVPQTMAELVTLPGVARKTANVVLGDAFGKSEGVVVDTHVMRLSQALGLTKEKKPEKIEQDLMDIVPKEEWYRFSHLLILYGRYKCTARMNINECPILADLFIK